MDEFAKRLVPDGFWEIVELLVPWDASAVSALDAITEKYVKRGNEVEIVGLNRPSADLHGELSGNLNSGH